MKDKKTKPNPEDLPTAVAILDQIVKPGTVLEFLGKPILFNNSKQSAVKELEVRICSTESADNAVLHKLHLQMRLYENKI